MRVAVALAVLVVLAGCSDAPKGDGTTRETFSTAPGTSAPLPADALDGSAPPNWQVGQSWTWRIESSRLTNAQETRLVVLSANGITYHVGATDFADAVLAYPFHLLGLGDIDATTLAWQAHGSKVQFLRFPLIDGDRFTNDFWSAPGADVELRAMNVTGPRGPEPGFRSTAYYAGSDTVFMEADYATARGQFVRVATMFGGSEPFAQATLVGDRANETGIAFRVTDLARWTATAEDPTTLTTRQATVASGVEWALIACFLPSEPGRYDAFLSVPGGASSCNGQGGDPAAGQYQAAAISTDGMGGAATVTPVVGGQGALTIEAFAIDTTLAP